MSQGRRHYDVLGFEGWDVLLALVVPRRLWLRMMAVRMLRQLKMSRGRGVLSMLLFPEQQAEPNAGFGWHFVPKQLPEGELTFSYHGRIWEVCDFAGNVKPHVQLAQVISISTRQ